MFHTSEINLYLSELFLYSKRKAEIKTNEMKEDIRKMTKLASSTLIDHKALIKADFARKEMNLQKFRKEVLDDLTESSDENEGSTGKKSQNVSSNYHSSHDHEIVHDYGRDMFNVHKCIWLKLEILSNANQTCAFSPTTLFHHS